MTSTNIYIDQKNYPYVYRLDNLITNEFYIGYRAANKVPAEQDLGNYYFTSSEIVKPKFNEFQITILIEFFTDTAGNDAYDHEQYLIYCDWGNPLMLNKNCYYGKKRFNFGGNSWTDKSKKQYKQNYQEKNGFDNPFQDPIIKEKIKHFNLEKTGYEYPLQNPEIKAKSKQTLLLTTGYDNTSKNPKTKNKKIQTSIKNFKCEYPMQNEEIKTKVKNTRIANNNGVYCSKEQSQKTKQTNLDRTGYEYPTQNPKTKEILKQNYQEKNGFDNPFQDPTIKEKIKQYNLEKYGVDHIAKAKFLSIIETKKTYNKSYISRRFPELKQYY